MNDLKLLEKKIVYMSSTHSNFLLPKYFKSLEWDGYDLPEIVRNIIHFKRGKLLFGGSSLIYHLYFDDEDWGERDYDIWSDHKTIDEILDYINDNYDKNDYIISEILCNNSFQSYSNIDIIYNITYKNYIIQLLKISKDIGISKLVLNIDFSFLNVKYDGNKIYFFDEENYEDMKKKIGIVYSDNNYRKVKNYHRIKKYQERGFIFKNLCPHCNLIINPNIEHYQFCLSRTFIYFINFHLDTKIISFNDIIFKNIDISENLLKEFIENNYVKNECNFFEISFLIILVSINNFSFFKKYIKIWEDINFSYNKEFLFKILVKFGATRYVKYLYNFCKDNNKEIDILVNNNQCIYIIYKNNFKELSKWFESICPYFEFITIDDRIISYKINTIFDLYTKFNDENILLNNIKNSKKNSEDSCAICKYSDSEIKLECGHSYCNTCLALYLKDNAPQCAYCKKDVIVNNYSEELLKPYSIDDEINNELSVEADNKINWDEILEENWEFEFSTQSITL